MLSPWYSPFKGKIMIKLREKDKLRICQLIEYCFSEPLEVWAYGSRVNGNSHDSSDLDLVLRQQGLKPLNRDEVNKFTEQLRTSNIPLLVEARDWAAIPESFHQQIIKKHEIFYSSIN